jgi:hypothetical protein
LTSRIFIDGIEKLLEKRSFLSSYRRRLFCAR